MRVTARASDGRVKRAALRHRHARVRVRGPRALITATEGIVLPAPNFRPATTGGARRGPFWLLPLNFTARTRPRMNARARPSVRSDAAPLHRAPLAEKGVWPRLVFWPGPAGPRAAARRSPACSLRPAVSSVIVIPIYLRNGRKTRGRERNVLL